jgi:hypothetical protein
VQRRVETGGDDHAAERTERGQRRAARGREARRSRARA